MSFKKWNTELQMNIEDNEYRNHEDNPPYSAPYRQSKLYALFEMGWHGNFCKYHVTFKNSSKDYSIEDDIDIFDVIIC